MVDPFYFVSYYHVRENSLFSISPDWITAIFTAISTGIIAWTAWLAKKSFWYTDQKDKTDRAIVYIDKLTNIEILQDMAYIVKTVGPWRRDIEEAKKFVNIEKIQDLSSELDDKISPKVMKILALLESIGLLLKHEKIDFPLIYDIFSLEMPKLWPNLEFFIISHQKNEPTAWKNVEYLNNRINKFKP